jgi:predicted metal-dependent hydrolase
LWVRRGTDRDTREAVLQHWYRRRLREQLPPLLARWEPKVGVTVSEVRIKKMKTRWGSCNAEARRIWLNLELAKKPASCLEYILVHEMVHILERRHDERFRDLMERLVPPWRLWREELNRAPLPHEEWSY